METIKNRRSIRSYTNQAIEEEKLLAILEAGRLAPSALNRQKWHFYVVSNPEKIAQLQIDCRNQKFIGEAPVVIVICSTEERIMSCGQKASSIDCSIVLSFMLLEANNQGLGTCWLGSFEESDVKKNLGIPQEYVVVGITPLGYPNENPAARPRKSLEEIVTYVK